MNRCNLLYHNVRMDAAASNERVEITLKGSPGDPLRIALGPGWRAETKERMDGAFALAEAGEYTFHRDR
ncbi:MAG: hypothetical protein JW955_14155 [Sedimentisphaerales bacterium]|nr:hypothetical protein [Sedimentisphaerales bacterium]